MKVKVSMQINLPEYRPIQSKDKASGSMTQDLLNFRDCQYTAVLKTNTGYPTKDQQIHKGGIISLVSKRSRLCIHIITVP